MWLLTASKITWIFFTILAFNIWSFFQFGYINPNQYTNKYEARKI